MVLAESTVCQIVVEVCKAIVEELWSEAADCHFLKSDEYFKENLLDINAERQFPYIFSGTNSSHLPIKCTKRWTGSNEAALKF